MIPGTSYTNSKTSQKNYFFSPCWGDISYQYQYVVQTNEPELPPTPPILLGDSTSPLFLLLCRTAGA